MYSILSFRWRRFAARLHRLRIALRSKGWRAVLGRARGAMPSMAVASHAPAGEPLGSPTPGPSGRRILIIDATTPRPDRDSGSLRLVNLMKLLLERGDDVDFLPDDRTDAGGYTQALRGSGIRVHTAPIAGDYPAWLERHGGSFDTIIVCRYHLGEFLIPLIRTLLPNVRVVLDTVDLHHLREEREARMREDATLMRLARETKRRELAAAAAADVIWVVSPIERSLLLEANPASHAVVVPNIHTLSQYIPGFAQRQGLLFIGGARHPPNVDAARWLLRDIFPRVRECLPNCTLHVVGDGMSEAVGGDAIDDGTVVHGFVPDLEPLLAGCRIGLAPLRFGAGVKGKVNACMAAGMPVVATSCAAEGMYLRDGEDVLIADADVEFAEAVVRLYADPALWHRLSTAGLDNVQRYFSLDIARAALDASFPP